MDSSRSATASSGRPATPVTADEVAFGIIRSMDGKTFPNGPGLSYSNAYFLGGEDYKGPYTDPGGTTPSRRSPSTATTSPSRWPSRSPTSPTTRRSRPSVPIPTDPAVSDPATYAQQPAVDRPVQDRAVHRRQVAHAGPQRPVGPGHRPGAHGVPGQLRVQGWPVGSSRSTRSCSTTPVTAKTTLTYDDVLAQDYRKFRRDRSPGHRRPALHLLLRPRPAQGDGQGHRRGADLGRPVQGPDRRRRPDPGRQRGRDPEPHASGRARS